MRLTEEQLQQLDEDGFLIIPGVFSAAEVDILRAQVPPMLAEDCPENQREAGSGATRNLLSLHRRNEIYARLVRHPRLVEPAMQILGDRNLYPQQVKINPKQGFEGGGFDWHIDFATHHKRDGVPQPLALNLHILLDDVTEFNGPLVFVPGSHKREIPLQRSVDGEKWELWTVPKAAVAELVSELGMVSAKGPRGTLLIFGDKLLHVSGHNYSPFSRWIFSLILNPVSNAATKDVPEIAHERERAPVVPLADDCLLQPVGTAA
ncbi:MAG: proline hydroxylase [Burkholderiaceae bacterium]|nr:proline hydroxylase [Burkholderiaceae bacterium]